ncbi:hypothetical protein XENTR_v10004978 [Xenopus tropicalis]|nr:hypothetical protein XENTR_v10004978 [Xenopus tropicalis]
MYICFFFPVIGEISISHVRHFYFFNKNIMKYIKLSMFCTVTLARYYITVMRNSLLAESQCNVFMFIHQSIKLPDIIIGQYY